MAERAGELPDRTQSGPDDRAGDAGKDRGTVSRFARGRPRTTAAGALEKRIQGPPAIFKREARHLRAEHWLEIRLAAQDVTPDDSTSEQQGRSVQINQQRAE